MMHNFIDELRNEASFWEKEQTLERNDYLICPGTTEKYIYFIESGAVRVFYVSAFEEHTIRFGYQHNIISSLASLIRQTPSEFYIQAIRKTKVKAVGKEKFRNYINADIQRMQAYQALLEELIAQQIEREVDILTQSPSERLERVLKRSPQLFQEIPAKYIASYLRMTPETLSRIQKS